MDNLRMVYIPEGFAHGFQALADNTELIYHHSAFYSPEFEQGCRYDDPAFCITWPLPVSGLSQRDSCHPFLCSHFRGIEL
jgi:dTDP-4-dehydrorhamnose 3,5-epimerase